MLYWRWLAFSIAMLALMQVACSIQVTCYGGGAESESGSVTAQMEAAKDATIFEEISIAGDDMSPLINISGPIKSFSQTHQVTDKSGKSAKVVVNVINAPDGLSYQSEVLPQEGALKTIEPQISAEQWISVPQADSIKCSASAYYRTLWADAGIEETKGKSGDEHVSLTEYNCKATASDKYVTAYQSAASGSGNTMKISNHARDASGIYGIETSVSGAFGLAASFQDMHAASSSGTSTQSAQEEHVSGKFSSTSRSGTKTTTRTSNYGTAYDLVMAAAKGSAPKGALGYYIDPAMTAGSAGAIQGAVNAARSGDTVNIAAGEYTENININKVLTLKGSGSPTASSFTLSSALGDGSEGITAPKVNVKASAKIQDGISLASSGGTVNVAAGSYSEDVSINKDLILVGSGNPIARSFSFVDGAALGIGSGGITAPLVNINSGSKIQDGLMLSSKNINVGPGYYEANIGLEKSISIKGSGKGITWIDGCEAGSAFTIYPGSKVSLSDMTITGGKAELGGGIFNSGTLTVSNCIISGNSADYGGGIFNAAKATVVISGSTISSNSAGVGGGIDNEGTTTVQGGCNISGNSADYGKGGGVHNAAKASLMVTGSTIYGNLASYGGGIDNEGIATVQGGSVISGNSADYGSGGGIHNSADAIVTVTGCNISSNTATFGGGVDNEGTATLQGSSTIIGNLADYGGGVYSAAEATTAVKASTVSGNTAMFDGGGVFSDGSTLSIVRSRVQDNTPNDIVEL